MKESRRSPRRPVVHGAWIFQGGSAPTVPCVMVDLSDAGARLKVDAQAVLPPQFILVMSRDGKLNRRCKAVWRVKDTVGVQFLSRDSVVPKAKKPARGFQIHVPEDAWPDDPEPVQTVEAPGLVPDPGN